MSNEVPEGWASGPVLDFFQLQRGHDLPVQDRNTGPVPIIASNGIVGFHDQSSLAGPGVITGRSGSIGNLNFVEGAYWPLNTTLYVRDFKSSDPKFVYYFLQNFPLKDHSTGTGVPTLNRNDVHVVEVVFPPLDEQRRIAQVLRSVDEAIVTAKDVAASMLRANQNMRQDLLKVSTDGTICELPSDWTVRDLEALATVERGKFSIRPRNDPRYFGGATPFIQTGDITSSDGYIEKHTQTLNELGVGVSRVFSAGTIMTTIAANIGDFAIATYPVACPDSVVGIEARKGVDVFWLYSVLTCFKVALDRASTQNAQKNINLQTLRPLQIPVPPRDLMIELAETLAASADGARQANAAAENLTALKRSIQADLLSGRVRVSG